MKIQQEEVEKQERKEIRICQFMKQMQRGISPASGAGDPLSVNSYS